MMRRGIAADASRLDTAPTERPAPSFRPSAARAGTSACGHDFGCGQGVEIPDNAALGASFPGRRRDSASRGCVRLSPDGWFDWIPAPRSGSGTGFAGMTVGAGMTVRSGNDGWVDSTARLLAMYIMIIYIP